MGTEALERYASLLKTTLEDPVGPRVRASQADPARQRLSRKRALANQPPTTVIAELAQALREQPSVFEGLLGLNSTRCVFGLSARVAVGFVER